MESVIDRLSSFYYLSDKQGLWSKLLTICLEQQIDLLEVDTWSLEEEQEQKFKIFEELVKKRSVEK